MNSASGDIYQGLTTHRTKTVVYVADRWKKIYTYIYIYLFNNVFQ